MNFLVNLYSGYMLFSYNQSNISLKGSDVYYSREVLEIIIRVTFHELIYISNLQAGDVSLDCQSSSQGTTIHCSFQILGGCNLK